MKAKKIDLSRYETALRDESAIPAMYDVRATLLNLLFHPDLNLSAVDTLSRQKLGHSIRHDESDVLLVSPEDHAKIQAAVEAWKGYSERDIEFLRRVIEAPEVDVDEQVATPEG